MNLALTLKSGVALSHWAVKPRTPSPSTLGIALLRMSYLAGDEVHGPAGAVHLSAAAVRAEVALDGSEGGAEQRLKRALLRPRRDLNAKAPPRRQLLHYAPMVH